MFRPTTSTAVLIALFLPTLAPSAEDPEFRTWTDATGKFKIEARFEKFEKGAVHLKRKDNGQVIAVPSAKLSKADQELVRKILSDKDKPASPPPKPAQATSTASALPKSWEGTWNNRKFNTNGPLKCTVTAKRYRLAKRVQACPSHAHFEVAKQRAPRVARGRANGASGHSRTRSDAFQS